MDETQPNVYDLLRDLVKHTAWNPSYEGKVQEYCDLIDAMEEKEFGGQPTATTAPNGEQGEPATAPVQADETKAPAAANAS